MNKREFINCTQILLSLGLLKSYKLKLERLKNEYNNKPFKKLLEYTYGDNCYGVTSDMVKVWDVPVREKTTYTDMFALLNALKSGVYTHVHALTEVRYYLDSNPYEADLFYKILDKDLRVGISARTINKVWPGLIPKPRYNRCGVFSEAKVKKNINFPAYIQLKCDGTYRETRILNGKVSIRTRQGLIYEDPVIHEQMRHFPDGYYLGELTVGSPTEPVKNRAEGNGLINSATPPYEELIYTLWDYLTPEDYVGLTKTEYKHRFERLREIINENNNLITTIKWVPYDEVNNIDEVYKKTQEYLSKGLEGAVVKDMSMLFKDGTNNQQLKVKLAIDCEMRIDALVKGTGKNQDKISVIVFSNDDRTIEGNCAGLSEEEMKMFTIEPRKYLGKIITVRFTDISKSPENDYYALVHPRFVKIRDDKEETDSLPRVKEMIAMARNIK